MYIFATIWNFVKIWNSATILNFRKDFHEMKFRKLRYGTYYFTFSRKLKMPFLFQLWCGVSRENHFWEGEIFRPLNGPWGPFEINNLYSYLFIITGNLQFRLPGNFDKKKSFHPVDCQQLKRTGARSAGRSAACNDFTPTACVRNMITWWGGPGTFIWTWVKKRRPRTPWRGSGRSMTAC
jgi:hypothetical protein